MKVVTFYAECTLPEQHRPKAAGFDWRGAIGNLKATVHRFTGLETVTVTDTRTDIEAALRVGDAQAEGVMLWLLDAQAAAIAEFGDVLMVSPDTLIAGPLVSMVGPWDVCLLTRKKPKAIVNSVMMARASAARVWGEIAASARWLSAESREWGADIDAVLGAFHVEPSENATREVRGITLRLLPVDGVFRTVPAGVARRIAEPIWDFKGWRKQRMPEYARFLL